MKQHVRQRVTIHDRYQVEIKVEYQLLPSQQTRYTISTYFFIPQTLGINEVTYPPAEFYRRIQNYIRLRTPRFTPQALLDDPASPLCIIERIIQEWSFLGDGQQQRLIDQCKFLRAILRRTLNRSLRQQWQLLDLSAERVEEAAVMFRHHLATVETILDRYRQCGVQIKQGLTTGNIAVDLLETYNLTDEALSLVVEENLLRAMTLATTHPHPLIRETTKAQIANYIRREVDYRRHRGYGSILQFEGDNEQYLHRISALKKYTSSVLYLGASVSREGATAEQLLFALAAGISMFFATVVAFYFQSRYGAFTFPVFIALVVGYMFKDRIKELGRLLSLRLLQSRYYDRRIEIHTLQDNQRLGRMREKMVFLKAAELPPRIVEERNQGVMSIIENGAQGEQILCYTRDVALHTKAFARIYPDGPPITGVADILRLDVRPFLHKMDDPIEQRLGLDGDRLRTVKCAKVYYINVVSVYTVGGTKEQIVSQRVRVTLNRKGLIRLQTMG
ncbi:MAG: hypothetical protein DYG89_20555 [Caldilinea sp. CFX5]|nr:hypothetical protein [Caldilinea sp. CFX5]